MILLSQEEEDIIIKAQNFFREEIMPSHIRNTEKLRDLRNFQVNPFLDSYKANFLYGNDNPENIARALLYPRILGTSINTIFGSRLQNFCNTVLEGFASTTSGIDIEFIDKIDGRRKYCQIKAGPNTINKDDVTTIKNHFKGIRNLARTNNLQVGVTDCVVGIFYGEVHELSNHYREIDKDFPVFVGKEFWHRLTGDEDFYKKITYSIAEVAGEVDSTELVESVVNDLTIQLSNQAFVD